MPISTEVEVRQVWHEAVRTSAGGWSSVMGPEGNRGTIETSRPRRNDGDDKCCRIEPRDQFARRGHRTLDLCTHVTPSIALCASDGILGAKWVGPKCALGWYKLAAYEGVVYLWRVQPDKAKANSAPVRAGLSVVIIGVIGLAWLTEKSTNLAAKSHRRAKWPANTKT